MTTTTTPAAGTNASLPRPAAGHTAGAGAPALTTGISSPPVVDGTVRSVEGPASPLLEVHHVSTRDRLVAVQRYATGLEMELGERRALLRAAEERTVELERELQQAQAREEYWREQALRDPLTGLLNRRGLLATAEQAWADDRPPAGLLVIDLNGFKAINDTYGHAAGDEVLAAVGSRLGSLLWVTAARTGGDEFVIIVDHGRPAPGLPHWLHPGIRAGIALSCGEAVSVSAAIGWTDVRAADVSIAAPLRRADEAVYCSKALGTPVHWRPSPHRRTAPTQARRAVRSAPPCACSDCSAVAS